MVDSTVIGGGGDDRGGGGDSTGDSYTMYARRPRNPQLSTSAAAMITRFSAEGEGSAMQPRRADRSRRRALSDPAAVIPRPAYYPNLLY